MRCSSGSSIDGRSSSVERGVDGKRLFDGRLAALLDARATSAGSVVRELAAASGVFWLRYQCPPSGKTRQTILPVYLLYRTSRPESKWMPAARPGARLAWVAAEA